MAGKKRKSTPPQVVVQPQESDDDSSSEEEQPVAQPTPSHAKTPKRTEQDDNESDSDSGSGSDSDSDPDPPTKTTSLPSKPLESEDSSSDEEDEEEQEKVENLKSPIKEPEPKKLKLSDSEQSLSMKSVSGIQRIWSLEDEIALLQALSDYHSKNGKLPTTKDYTSFLSGISGSISFPVTEKQLTNKLRQLKNNYDKKIKKGPDVKFSKPHEKAVFKMCHKLFEDITKASKGKVSVETNRVAGTENGAVASGVNTNGGVVNSGAANGDAAARSNFYLRSFIEVLISRQQGLSHGHTIEAVVAQMGESRLQDLEAKAKALKIEEIKLLAREEKFMAELLGDVAEEMADE
ncbi:uncharacterized protein LOC144553318 [Carex rostrata]